MYVPIKTILAQTSLSRATIYRMMNAGEFPQSVKLGPKKTVWRESDVANWRARKEAGVPVFAAEETVEDLLG